MRKKNIIIPGDVGSGIQSLSAVHIETVDADVIMMMLAIVVCLFIGGKVTSFLTIDPA